MGGFDLRMLAEAVYSASHLDEDEIEAIKALIANWDEDGFPMMSCGDCPAKGPRLAGRRRTWGCPHEGGKGKADTGDHPLKTCPGWYFEQPETWQIRDIHDCVLQGIWGDVENKSNLYSQIVMKYKRFSSYFGAMERKEKRRLDAVKSKKKG